MGGKDGIENIAVLTAREHYLVHWLLFKIHKNKAMAFAWYRMSTKKNSVDRYNSWTFCYAKKARKEAMSAIFNGRPLSEQHKQKLRLAKIGKKYAELGRGVSPLAGRSISDEHKRKVAEKSKGRMHTSNSKEKMRLTKMGALNPMFGKNTPEETRRKISESMSRYFADKRMKA